MVIINSTPPVFPGEHHESDYEQKNDFDWQSLKAVCIGSYPTHPAYGMSFEEYAKRRGDVVDNDGHPTAPMCFRLPAYPAFVIPSFARRRKAQTGGSLYRYMILTLEMGLIKFQHDYHDLYMEINAATDALVEMTPEEFEKHKWLCERIGGELINLRTASRENKAFTPSVAHWLSSAVKQVCGDLKMTQSDLIALCLFIGIIEESKTMTIPSGVLAEFRQFISKFDYYIMERSNTLTTVKKGREISKP